ncbi:MAG TPA: YeeE/YedE family protein [Rhodopila sp.]|nr:YeeE/YedE family protein [Rhodopila sp.]
MLPRLILALIAGALFGLGLTISQMINPAKVLGFLDFAGNWDPSLALVLISAVAVAAIGFACARRRATPLLDSRFVGPSATHLDRRLLAGATLFGIGWGLIGYCPGPALASLSVGGLGSGIFVIAMLAGMAAFSWLDRQPAQSTDRD